MEEELNIVSLSLGSNLGDKERNLQNAIQQINKLIGEVFAVSSYVESKPWGFVSQNDFLNACCLVKTKMSVDDFISVTQQIEREMGRKVRDRNDFQDRIIDIDVIFFGEKIINNNKLTIPHKNFRKRDFVLYPLSQISNQIDPETFLSIYQFRE
jgi:2-amino-4-hydroxy-6-hydroxymethyldihydropteridine diphosphokinase